MAVGLERLWVRLLSELCEAVETPGNSEPPPHPERRPTRGPCPGTDTGTRLDNGALLREHPPGQDGV